MLLHSEPKNGLECSTARRITRCFTPETGGETHETDRVRLTLRSPDLPPFPRIAGAECRRNGKISIFLAVRLI
jgi:hypothetical protein